MLYDAGSKTIIYEGDEVARAETIPGHISRAGYCAVKATYANLLALNEMDLDVPNPMEAYDWPSQPGTEPFGTQKLVSSFMVLNPRSFVISDLRTGKTRAALWAADWLMRASARKLQCLILSDINALEGAWSNEITSHFLGRRTFEMLHHTAEKKRLDALAKDADFYLLNHDGLRMGRPRKVVEYDAAGRPVRQIDTPATGLYAALLEKKFDIIIFDEAATYRSTDKTTEMFKCALSLSKNAPFVYLLTGTPTPNGPLDAHGLKRLCHPAWKVSKKKWRDLTTTADGPFRRKPVPAAAALVDELLQPSVRITQDQCFTPTPLTIMDLQVKLTPAQKEATIQLKQELSILLEGGRVDAVNQAALRAKLIQLSCGVVYDQDHKARFIDAAPRIEAFCELIHKIPGKIIVFAPLTSVLEMLAEKAGPSATLLKSSLSKNNKLKLLRTWQQDDTSRVLLSHPGPVARGTDLSTASTIIWYAPIDRTEYFIQANERINGVNQTKPRYIIRMSGCDIEAGIYDRLESNTSLQGLILKLKEMVI